MKLKWPSTFPNVSTCFSFLHSFFCIQSAAPGCSLTHTHTYTAHMPSSAKTTCSQPKGQMRSQSISTPSQAQLLKIKLTFLNFVLCSRAGIAARVLHNANQRPHFLQKKMNYCSSQVPLQVPNVHSLSFSVCLSP